MVPIAKTAKELDDNSSWCGTLLGVKISVLGLTDLVIPSIMQRLLPEDPKILFNPLRLSSGGSGRLDRKVSAKEMTLARWSECVIKQYEVSSIFWSYAKNAQSHLTGGTWRS
ncbi:MAG: hypothetical protein CML33_06925 [Rhodobacteraceae bacterium]|nr:hypothetical protein [Paracoccaceae bacterium]